MGRGVLDGMRKVVGNVIEVAGSTRVTGNQGLSMRMPTEVTNHRSALLILVR